MQKQKIIILIVLILFLGGYFYYSRLSNQNNYKDEDNKITPKITLPPVPTLSQEDLEKMGQEIALQYTVSPKDMRTEPEARSVEMSDLDERLAKAGITKAPVSMFNDSTKFPLTEAAIRYAYPLYRSDQQYQISKEAFETVLNDVLMSDKQEYKDIFAKMRSEGISLPDKATIPFFNCFILYSNTFEKPFQFLKKSKKDLQEGKTGEYDIIGAFFFLNLRSWLTQVSKENLLENDAFYSFETKDLAITPEIMSVFASNVVYKFKKEDVFFITTFKQPIYLDNFIHIPSMAFSNYQNNDIQNGNTWIRLNNECKIKSELEKFPVVSTNTFIY